MRIAMLAPITRRIPPRPYGPEEQLISDLTEGMVERGHEVTLFAAANSLTRAELISVCPQPLVEWDQDPWPDPRWWEDLHIAECMIRASRGDFDVVHNHLHVKALPSVANLRVPVLTNLHSVARDQQVHAILRRFQDQPFVCTGPAERKLLPELNYVAEIPPPDPEESRAIPRMVDTYEKLLTDLVAGLLPSPVMNTRRLLSWGQWEDLDRGIDYKVRRLEVKPRARLTFEAPHNVRKNLIALSRGFEAVVNGENRHVEPGASLDLPPGAIHEILNPTDEPLLLLELLRGAQGPSTLCEPIKVE